MARTLSLEALAELTDLKTMQRLREVDVPNLEQERGVSRLGNVVYVDFGRNSQGLWLPTEFVTSDTRVDDPEIQRKLDQVRSNLSGMQIASAGNHYALNGIGGDIIINTLLNVNREVKDTVILPQAWLRGEGNCSTMKILNIDHPLTNDVDRMLHAMVVLGARSGLPAPYVRLLFTADQGNGMGIADEVLKGTVLGSTYSYSDPNVPSYQSGAPPKKLFVVPTPIQGHITQSGKICSRYIDRLYDYRRHINARGLEDTAHMLHNGLIADGRCFNTWYFVENAETGRVKVISIEPTPGNYFFKGKTDHTGKIILTNQRTKLDSIEFVEVSTPEEFAYEAGVNAHTIEKLKGIDLTNYVIQQHVKYMTLLGTYKGLIGVSGIDLLASDGEIIPVIFEPSENLRKAINDIYDLLITTCYAVNGGTRLTSDLRMCGIYDAEAARSGRLVRIPITPETRLEDTTQRYTPGNFKFAA